MHPAGQASYKLLIVLAMLCLVLALVAGRLWWRLERADGTRGATGVSGVSGAPAGSASGSAGDRAGVVAGLVAAGNGLWDSSPDADVARVLQPGLVNRDDNGIRVSSNAYGMRERDYALPKPAGTLRIVLLGDSFIYGMGVQAEQRFGVLLERLMGERLTAAGLAAPPIEVLHLGMTSWNIVAECAFLRRQLSLLQPDLVVQVVVPNDVDDTVGVRGMGVLARLVPRHPEQADVALSMNFGRWALDPQSKGLLGWGMDDESRLRLQEAGDELARLAHLVEAQGGRYLLVAHWQAFNAVAAEFLASRLRPEQVCWLPTSFYRDERYRLSAADEHWNPAGHERMAAVLYGWIEERGLLPAVKLPRWDEARAFADELDHAGSVEAHRPGALAGQQASKRPSSTVDLARLDPVTSGQIHGGIAKDGSVGPFASLLLARDGGRTLHVTGRCLPRAELDGAQVQVFVDREPVGSIALAAGAPIDFRAPLPDAALAHDWVTLRLQAGDFVYAGADLRQCVAFKLERAAIEP